MKPTLANVRSVVEKFGGTISFDECANTGGNVDAPDGHTWDGDLHAFRFNFYPGEPRSECWADLLDRLQEPEPCGCEDCKGE